MATFHNVGYAITARIRVCYQWVSNAAHAVGAASASAFTTFGGSRPCLAAAGSMPPGTPPRVVAPIPGPHPRVLNFARLRNTPVFYPGRWENFGKICGVGFVMEDLTPRASMRGMVIPLSSAN